MKTIINKILESGIFWGIVVSIVFIGAMFLDKEVLKYVAASIGIVGLVCYFKYLLPEFIKQIKGEKD